MTKASYSNVIYSYSGSNSPLTSITEANLSNIAQKPEENIVERYVSQFSSQTKSISATLGLGITPFTKVKAIDIYEPTQGYAVLGSEIDYKEGSQNITMMEKK